MRAAAKLGRGAWRAVLVALAFGGLFAAGAGGKTVRVGQLFTPTFDGCGPGTALQMQVASGNSYRVPKSGVITSWSWHDGANVVPSLELKVGRRISGTTYKIVGQSTAGTQAPNSVEAYPARIPVHAGDLIGVYEDGGSCFTGTSSGKDRYAWVAVSDVAAGMEALFQPVSNAKFPASAKVALDCVVPNLKGKTLKAAKKALKAHSCTLGTVIVKGRTVTSQQPAAGKTLAPRAKVNIRLG